MPPPPGWKVPSAYGVSPPRGEDPAPVTRAATPVPLPTRGLEKLLASVGPGLHLIVGPHGSGKTQLAVQWGVQSALLGVSTRLCFSQTPQVELALRIAAHLSKTPWGELLSRGADEGARHLDRLGSAPLTVDPLESDPTPEQALDGANRLVISDPAPGPETLASLRRQAVLQSTTWVVVCPGAGAEPAPGASPLQLARAHGADDATLALADTVWVLAPQPAPKTVVHLAKSRGSRPSSAHLSFDGARFEDEPDELQLGLEV